jgi:hypothetical protein
MTTTTPYLDIGLLFSDDEIKFEDDPKILENKLRQSGVVNIEQLQQLTPSELFVLRFSESDAQAILKQSK